MEPPFSVPVETILKVDEEELLVKDNQIVPQSNTSQTNVFLIGTQCNNWKTQSPQSKSCNLLFVSDTQGHNLTTEDKSVDDKNSEEISFAISEWPHNTNDSLISNPKPIPSTLAQPISCNFQALPIDDKFFLQFDYKTRNKLKTKQRRLDPFYRSQERVRQRTVMRIKRQDPEFRAAEREKGRYRMRIKRLNPEFRSQERVRQRERMKIKRSDPDFRDKEREQQKTRLQEKRLDPVFKEKERAQDRLRMCIKQESNGLYSARHSDKSNSSCNSLSMVFLTKNQSGKGDTSISNNSIQLRNTQAAFPENIDTETLSNHSQKESAIEAFHLKKQKILNFNFYNSSKEQWTAHGELCPKAITLVSVGDQNEEFKCSLKNELISSLHDEISSVSKKKLLKDVKPEKLLNIVHELPLIVQQQSLSETTKVVPTEIREQKNGRGKKNILSYI